MRDLVQYRHLLAQRTMTVFQPDPQLLLIPLRRVDPSRR
jgi:hypothetical protein